MGGAAGVLVMEVPDLNQFRVGLSLGFRVRGMSNQQKEESNGRENRA